MHWSALFIPTLRENPAEAEVAAMNYISPAATVRHVPPG
jgi:prolyl-tRNA synthetase